MNSRKPLKCRLKSTDSLLDIFEFVVSSQTSTATLDTLALWSAIQVPRFHLTFKFGNIVFLPE